VLGLLAALVGATWISTDADILRFQFLLPMAVALVALGLAVGQPRPRI
jgi:hypothetical protein